MIQCPKLSDSITPYNNQHQPNILYQRKHHPSCHAGGFSKIDADGRTIHQETKISAGSVLPGGKGSPTFQDSHYQPMLLDFNDGKHWNCCQYSLSNLDSYDSKASWSIAGDHLLSLFSLPHVGLLHMCTFRGYFKKNQSTLLTDFLLIWCLTSAHCMRTNDGNWKVALSKKSSGVVLWNMILCSIVGCNT